MYFFPLTILYHTTSTTGSWTTSHASIHFHGLKMIIVKSTEKSIPSDIQTMHYKLHIEFATCQYPRPPESVSFLFSLTIPKPMAISMQAEKP